MLNRFPVELMAVRRQFEPRSTGYRLLLIQLKPDEVGGGQNRDVPDEDEVPALLVMLQYGNADHGDDEQCPRARHSAAAGVPHGPDPAAAGRLVDGLTATSRRPTDLQALPVAGDIAVSPVHPTGPQLFPEAQVLPSEKV